MFIICGQFYDTLHFSSIIFVIQYGTCRRFTITLFAYIHTHVYFSKSKLLNNCVILRLAVLAEHRRLVTDRHRQTYDDTTTAAAAQAWRREVKNATLWKCRVDKRSDSRRLEWERRSSWTRDEVGSREDWREKEWEGKDREKASFKVQVWGTGTINNVWPQSNPSAHHRTSLTHRRSQCNSNWKTMCCVSIKRLNILPSLIKFRPSPNLATAISESFVVSVLTLIPTQLAPLPPPSFTSNSITVILSTTTYLSLRSPAYRVVKLPVIYVGGKLPVTYR